MSVTEDPPGWEERESDLAEDGDWSEATDPEGDDDEGIDPGNRLVGARPSRVAEMVAKAIVDEPEGVFVDVSSDARGVALRLHVAPADMGKVIGRRGRVASALRQVVRAAGAAEGVEANLEIVD